MSHHEDEAVDFSAPVVIAWQPSDNDVSTRFLAQPDPSRADILLESHLFSETSSRVLKLIVPVKFKGEGCDARVCVLIRRDSIASFDIDTSPEAPEVVSGRLACSTIRLHIQLNQPVEMVAPNPALEPLQPKRATSGRVLDALRSIAAVKALTIYGPVEHLPLVALQTFIPPSVHPCSPQIIPRTFWTGLFGGKGGKIVHMPVPALASPVHEPPSYNTIVSPRPTAPLEPNSTSLPKSKKRRRAESRDDADSLRDSILVSIKVQMDKHAHDLKEQLQRDFEVRLQAQKEQLEKQHERRIRNLEGTVKAMHNHIHLLTQKHNSLVDGVNELDDHCENLDCAVQVLDDDLIKGLGEVDAKCRHVDQAVNILNNQVDEVHAKCDQVDGRCDDIDAEVDTVRDNLEHVRDKMTKIKTRVKELIDGKDHDMDTIIDEALERLEKIDATVFLCRRQC